MQEHGVLERILLIYDEAARRIEHSEQFEVAVVTSAAGIVRHFVQDYHEKLEEQFVFPKLQTARREVDLVGILLRQHERGRGLTEEIVRKTGTQVSAELAQTLRSFSRMYRPHAAREDSVPGVSRRHGTCWISRLGEQFEEKEHQLFGEHGFQEVVGQVAELERALGIHDLASFTPA